MITKEENCDLLGEIRIVKHNDVKQSPKVYLGTLFAHFWSFDELMSRAIDEQRLVGRPLSNAILATAR